MAQGADGEHPSLEGPNHEETPLRASAIASSRLLSKYEYARILSARVTELANNASPTIEARPPHGAAGLLWLAKEEFSAGAIQLNLVRRVPSGGTQSCATSSLFAVPNRMQRKPCEPSPQVVGLDAHISDASHPMRPSSRQHLLE